MRAAVGNYAALAERCMGRACIGTLPRRTLDPHDGCRLPLGRSGPGQFNERAVKRSPAGFWHDEMTAVLLAQQRPLLVRSLKGDHHLCCLEKPFPSIGIVLLGSSSCFISNFSTGWSRSPCGALLFRHVVKNDERYWGSTMLRLLSV
jgi:hypothetical protein